MPKLNEEQQAIAEEGGEGFTLLTPGLYLGTLNEVESREGPKGEYWNWEFAITEDDEGNVLESAGKVWEITSLAERSVWRVAEMFSHFGYTPDSDTDEILGQSIYVQVGVETISEGPRAGQERNVYVQGFPV